jgi:hypothetical protein
VDRQPQRHRVAGQRVLLGGRVAPGSAAGCMPAHRRKPPALKHSRRVPSSQIISRSNAASVKLAVHFFAARDGSARDPRAEFENNNVCMRSCGLTSRAVVPVPDHLSFASP